MNCPFIFSGLFTPSGKRSLKQRIADTNFWLCIEDHRDFGQSLLFTGKLFTRFPSNPPKVYIHYASCFAAASSSHTSLNEPSHSLSLNPYAIVCSHIAEMFLIFPFLVLCKLFFVTAAPHSARQDGFTNSKTFVFDGNSLPDGLAASNYPAGAHTFSSANAFVSDGYLQLKVPGGQAIGNVACGEVSTTMTNILYGSVRTVAILSRPAGTVNGSFGISFQPSH